VHRHRLEHNEQPFVVGPIDLTLRRGEILFLVGGNGSGKSTLAKLIVGLYEPEAGEIFVNGARVAAADRESYRQNFSAVFADFHVFERLLGCGTEDVAGRAKHWLDRLGLAHKVEVRGDALSTTRLSSGQRKRLALLVAALEERPICCFDEWAADQDPEYKRVFYTELLPALAAQGRTLIVVTHDDHYFHVATRCVALEAGRLSSLEPARGREERPGPAPAGDVARAAVVPPAPGTRAGASWS
jgi:putative ATP-binding cassette transporter